MSKEKKKNIFQNQLLRKIVAGLLFEVMLLGVIAPVGSLWAYANPESHSITFKFINKKGSGIAGVTVELRELVEDPVDPTNPTDPVDPSEPTETSEPINPPESSVSPERKSIQKSTQMISVSTAASDETGEVIVDNLQDGVYQYTITVPQGYQQLGDDVREGMIEVNGDNITLDPVTIYAELPALELQSSDQAVYGNVFHINAVVIGLEEGLIFAWKKDGELLSDESGSTLTLNLLSEEQTGEYQCIVTSELTEDETALVDATYPLAEIEKAVPVISMSFDPASGSQFQKNGFRITVTAEHAAGAVPGTMKPTGKIVLTTAEGEMDPIELTLTNGTAQSGKIRLKSGTYQVQAKYVPNGDPNYKSKYEDETPDTSVSYVIATRPTSNNDYIVSEPYYSYYDGHYYPWYNVRTDENGDEVYRLKIRPNKDNSPYDKIRLPGETLLRDELVVDIETTESGKTVRFELVDGTTKESAEYVFGPFRQDLQPPSDPVITYKSGWIHVHGIFTSEDNNEVKRFRLYFLDDSDPGTDDFVETEVTSYNKLDFQFPLAWESKDAWRFTVQRFVSAVAIDIAGNESGTVSNPSKIIDVDISRDEGAERTDEVVYHNSPVVFTINAYSRRIDDNITVWINDSSPEELTWEYIEGDVEEGAQYRAVVTTPREEGEYTLHIEAPDYVITANEFDEDPSGESGQDSEGLFTSLKHIIDLTPPEIWYEYDPEQPADGLTAYPESISLRVCVKEAHFNPDRFVLPKDEDEEEISIIVEDLLGNSTLTDSEQQTLRENLWDVLTRQVWQEKENEQDVYISSPLLLEKEGIYSFYVACTDRANNSGEESVSKDFTIDHSKPEELTIQYDTSAVNILLETLTFGFYNSEVEATVTAQDTISGVDHFDVDYHPQNGYDPEEDHYTQNYGDKNWTIPKDQIDCNIDQENGTVTYTGHFTLPLESGEDCRQYRGSLAFTATDGAGLKSDPHNGKGIAFYFDEDGNCVEIDMYSGDYEASEDYALVIDTIPPSCTVTYPEPALVRESDGMAILAQGEIWENRTDCILYYNDEYFKQKSEVPVTIEIEEANFDPQDEKLQVKLYTIDAPDGELYQVAWEQKDSDNPYVWTGVVHLQADGFYCITVDYTDRSGNPMDHYESNKIVLDRAAPSVDRYEFTPATVDGDTDTTQFIEELEYGFYFKTDFKVTVYCSDPAPSAGLNTLTYRLLSYENGRLEEEQNQITLISDGKAYLSIPAGFKGQIFAFARDYANNASAEVTPQAMVVDQTPPTIEIVTNGSTPYTDGNGNRLFTETVSFTVTIRDTVSGLREIGWLQNAELHPTERAATNIPNTGVHLGDTIGDGWIVGAMDRNLVTEAHRTFAYAADDNDIKLVVDALDRSTNRRSDIQSETVTVDKTAPVITVVLTGGGRNNDIYYDAERTATITVTERNFDAARINVTIQNSFGAVPEYTFTGVAGNIYTATVRFQEGNYHFDVNGTDRGNHPATVTFTGGHEHEFVVDLTNPAVVTNFPEFKNNAQNNFREDKTVRITITDHNFNINDRARTGLHIYQKKAGEPLTEVGLVDITASILANNGWTANGDVYSFSFTFTEEAVYMVTIAPIDLSDRPGGQYSTVVFEIDKTKPVVSKRNGVRVEPDSTEFLDIYSRDRRNAPAPTVTFSDTHIDHLEYTVTTWIPNYTDENNYPKMVPEERSGRIDGDTFKLENFESDGIYTVSLVAFDIAGNRSETNVNTYVRIIENSILAYIKDSSIEQKTGLFSFEDEDGIPRSLRPDMLQDLTIMVYGQAGSEVEVLIRDSNGDEETIGELTNTRENGYGMEAYTYLVSAERFSDLYQGDADTTLILTVRNGDAHIDLGMIHIDNIVPTCILPDEFHNWKWYFGKDTRTVTLTDISEELDEAQCAVYDKGISVPIKYSSKERTITFDLPEGWHNVGIVLRDLAGNTNNIQEVTNIHVGLFWLWIIIASAVVFGGLGAFIGIRIKRRKTETLDE